MVRVCRMLALVTLLAAVQAAAGESWPQWMGPGRNWHTSEPSGLWPPRKLWEKNIGPSDSSPILVNGRIYVTTLVTSAGKAARGEDTAVICLDAETGAVVWQSRMPGGKYGRFHTGDENQYCGPLSTPACDGQRVFALSVDGDLRCFDAAGGQMQWGFNLYDRFKMGPRKAERDFGYTSSPMLLSDRIVVEVGGNRGAVMAFAKTDGRELSAWGKGQAGHSSGPSGSDGTVYFGLESLVIGKTVIDWKTQFACNIATPGWEGQYVVGTSGYNVARTRCYRNGKMIWESPVHDTVGSPVVHQAAGNAYVPGAGRCLSLADGSARWRIGQCASVIVTGDGKVLAFGKKLRLYEPDGRLVSEVTVAPAGWAAGALAEGKIVCRARDRLAVYSVSGDDKAKAQDPKSP